MLKLSDLERVAPALLPHRSATVRPIDWQLLRTSLGVALPADYREFADRYPALSIAGSMILRVPEPGDESAFVSGVHSIGEEMAFMAVDEVYTFHPEADGLICWGGTDTGDTFFWRNNGPDPDRWPAVVFTRNDYRWEHEGGFLALLVGLIDGSIEGTGLSELGTNPGIEPAVRAPSDL